MADLFILPLLAAALGFALARSNSCTVAATVRLVEDRKADYLLGLGVAAATATLLLAMLTLWNPGSFRLPLHLEIGWAPILGGMVMGMGALLNKGCMLGSISALGRGNLNYLFTIGGIAISLAAMRRIYELPMVGDGMADYGEARLLPLSVGAALILIGIGLRIALRDRNGSAPYLMLAGTVGALLFATNPYWSYLAAVYRGVSGDMFGAMIGADIAAIVLFLGATFSAWLRDRLDVVGIELKQALACLVGGMAMGVGAQIIPGGNDTLLLWTIPGLATYGIVAYLVMIATIAIGAIMLGRIGAWRLRQFRSRP